MRGLFAGYGSFLLRDLPFDAIEFLTYEQLKKAYRATLLTREPNSLEISALGMLLISHSNPCHAEAQQSLIMERVQGRRPGR